MHRLIISVFISCTLLLSGLPAIGEDDVPLMSLSQKNLRGSLQGQSGIVSDLNGYGRKDLVIGAPNAIHGNTTGSLLVYLARREGGFALHPSEILEGDGNLGWSLVNLGPGVFASGALNGSSDDVSLSGTVTVYRRGAGGVPKKAALLAGENALDKFGYVLATGDFNGDGYLDLVVGAPFYSPSPALYQKGAVYIFFGPDFKRSVKIPGTVNYGGIGLSVAAGDINKDGIDDLLIQTSGKVIAYLGSKSFSPMPDKPDIVYNSQNSTDTDFGHSIAVLRDIDGSGGNKVAIGASQATLNNGKTDMIDSGRLYIFGNSLSSPLNPPTLLATIDGEPNSGRFASAILPVGDINSDGIPDLAVASIHADGTPWPMTGAIFFVDCKSLKIIPEKTIRGTAKDMHLGTFMARLPGSEKLVVGAPTKDANTGAVLIYSFR